MIRQAPSSGPSPEITIRWRPGRGDDDVARATLEVTYRRGGRYRVRSSVARDAGTESATEERKSPDPRPVGAPADLRQRLARALGTDDPGLLAAAEADYRGVYESEHEYIADQVATHLQPPDMTWILACCEPAKLREGYQGRALVVWSLPYGERARLVFETVRDHGELLRRVLREREADGEREAACPLCGATDWMIFLHTDDRALVPLGCDRCIARPRA
ncbi:MAG TPA: hypothetical protein VIK91_27070 [Nannocystis sp.]